MPSQVSYQPAPTPVQPPSPPAPAGSISYADNPRRKFVQVDQELLRSPHLSDGAKVLYANIVSYDWGDHPTFPGLDTLAHFQGKSRQQISSYMRELKAANVIVVERRGLNQPNVYHIQGDSSLWTLDVKPSLHPVGCKAEFTSRRKAEVTSRRKVDFPSDVNPALHYVDVPRQVQTERGIGGLVSRAPARAWSPPPWLDPVLEACLSMAGLSQATTAKRTVIGQALAYVLVPHSPAERMQFLGYLFSTEYAARNVGRLPETIKQDYDDWASLRDEHGQYPIAKRTRPAPQATPRRPLERGVPPRDAAYTEEIPYVSG